MKNTKPLIAMLFFALLLTTLAGCSYLDQFRKTNPPPNEAAIMQLDYEKEGFRIEIPSGWRALNNNESQVLGLTIAPTPESIKEKTFFVFVKEESDEMIGLSISPGPIEISSKALTEKEFLSALSTVKTELETRHIPVQSIEIFDSPALQGALVTSENDSLIFIARHRGKEYFFSAKVASKATLLEFINSLRWNQPILTPNIYQDPNQFYKVGLPENWKMTERENFPTDIETAFGQNDNRGPKIKITISENQYEPENFSIYNLSLPDQKKYLAKDLARLEKNYDLLGISYRQAGNSIGLYGFVKDKDGGATHLIYLTYHKGRYVLARLKFDSQKPTNYNELNDYLVYQVKLFNDTLDSIQFLP